MLTDGPVVNGDTACYRLHGDFPLTDGPSVVTDEPLVTGM